MSTVLIVALSALVLLLLVSGVLSVLMFYRNPPVGSMFFSLQMMTGVGLGLSVGSFDLKIGTNGWSGTLMPGQTYLELNTGGPGWLGVAVLAAAVIVFVASMRKYVPVVAVAKETKKPALIVRYARFIRGRYKPAAGKTDRKAG